MMDTYTFLRTFAESWLLLGLTLFFIGVLFWAFRPGSRPLHDGIANSIFRNEDKPAGTALETARNGKVSKEVRK